jgi:N-acetylglutamate synthase-like GNAT family acetyltransferase
VLIRRASEDDVGAIERIVAAAYGPYVEQGLPRPQPLDEDYAAKVRAGSTFVAVSKTDKIVATLGVAVQDDHLLVENVAVDPAWSGKGIGPWLLEYAEALATGLGLPELRLYTQAAMTANLALYEKLGWRETDRRTEHGLQRVFFSRTVRADA